MNNQNYRSNGPFRSGFSQGFNYGKTYMVNGSGRLLYNVGNVLGRGAKLISVGAGKFFTTAKNIGKFIGKTITHLGQVYRVLGKAIWRGVKGFFLKLVRGAEEFAKDPKEFAKKVVAKAKKAGSKIHQQYIKFADKITPEVKPYNAFGGKKSKKKMAYQQRERTRKVEARAYTMEGATVALGIAGIKGIVNAYDNLPSRAKKEND